VTSDTQRYPGRVHHLPVVPKTSNLSVCALTKEQRIAAAQQHLLYDRLLLSALLSMGVSLLFAGLLKPYFSWQLLLEWLAAIQIVGALRLGLWYWHRRARPTPEEAPKWSRRFVAGAALAAIAWSLGPVQMMPAAGDVSMAILVVTLLAVSSVAVSSLAAHIPSMAIFMGLTLGPAGVQLILSSGQVEFVVGIALLAAIVALCWTGYQGHASIRRLLEIELELSESVMVTAQARATAEEANRAKSRFLATMSHEIRTPLNGVLGLTEILQASGLNHEQSRHLDLLRRSGAHLLDIVNDILDFSKIEAEQLDLTVQPVALRELVDEVAGPWRARIAMSDVGFEAIIDDAVPGVVLTDAVRMRQVLGNFLSNAVKFTERGSISLRVEVLDGKPGDADALLRFRVIDTGIGIAPDRIGKVFDAFTQVDDSSARRAGGTGLGLAICRRLANLLGGEVGAASEPGKGSTFVFSLRVPVNYWPAVAPNRAAASRAPSPTRLAGRVLLVEDNAINLEVAGAMLSLLGVEYEAVEDGQSAIDKASTGQFDAALMDCQMPGVDGYRATIELRRRNARARNGQRLPIIALTANAFAEDRAQAAAAGMDAFLSKPVQLDQLSAVLVRWLDGRADNTAQVA
jgi:signal transduction histidine kinase/ActR/RegA family two-component response regulator